MEVLEELFAQLPMFQRIGASAYKPNLNNTWALMEALHHPEQRFKSIHVAGTNGKGSTSHLLASVFQEAGYKTGLYTSPHLKDFRERIKINGTCISKSEVIDFYENNKRLFTKIKSSFFEMTVALAFDYFARERVDIAIIEVGMGGRLDSTNVIQPELSVITNISLDHVQFLGDTIVKIAEEKAGIIKANTPLVIGETQLQTALLFTSKAKELQAPIYFADALFTLIENKKEKDFVFDILKKGSPYISGMSCGLLGSVYQSKNVLTTLCALDILKQKYDISEENTKKGFEKVIENTGLLGRWQCLSEHPCVICDTGHNEAGIRMVLKQLEQTSYAKLHFVIGMVSDKDIDKVLSMLPIHASYYFCKADIPRGLEAELLAKKAMEKGLKGKVYSSVKKALEAAKKEASNDDLIFVGGSTFVVAEVC
ncbi:MAG: folylpolyglutamate synthase/dihydrofolate synthase family protein [Bacteroidales bacterium]